jgi:hypothetical protein
MHIVFEIVTEKRNRGKPSMRHCKKVKVEKLSSSPSPSLLVFHHATSSQSRCD